MSSGCSSTFAMFGAITVTDVLTDGEGQIDADGSNDPLLNLSQFLFFRYQSRRYGNCTCQLVVRSSWD